MTPQRCVDVAIVSAVIAWIVAAAAIAVAVYLLGWHP